MLDMGEDNSVPTHKMAMSEAGLTGEVWEAVQGAGSKQALQRPFFVGNDAWLKCRSWLAVGWKIWKG